MRYCLLIFVALAFSCANQKKRISDEQLNLLLNKNLLKYYETNNKKTLIKAYKKLSLNDHFNEKVLTGENSLPIISLMLILKKYDELERLLETNKTFAEYNRTNTLNIVRYLRLRDNDSDKAFYYIDKNITMIKDSLIKSPQDSLLYADYFTMRMFLLGKEKTLIEIDSMRKANTKFSDIFYDIILREPIELYPNDLLYK